MSFQPLPSSSRRRYQALGFVVLVIILSWALYDSPVASPLALAGFRQVTQGRRLPRRTHVALATTFGDWHHDVLVPIAQSFESVLGPHDHIRLYNPQPGERMGIFHFEEVGSKPFPFPARTHIASLGGRKSGDIPRANLPF